MKQSHTRGTICCFAIKNDTFTQLSLRLPIHIQAQDKRECLWKRQRLQSWTSGVLPVKYYTSHLIESIWIPLRNVPILCLSVIKFKKHRKNVSSQALDSQSRSHLNATFPPPSREGHKCSSYLQVECNCFFTLLLSIHGPTENTTRPSTH